MKPYILIILCLTLIACQSLSVEYPLVQTGTINCPELKKKAKADPTLITNIRNKTKTETDNYYSTLWSSGTQAGYRIRGNQHNRNKYIELLFIKQTYQRSLIAQLIEKIECIEGKTFDPATIYPSIDIYGEPNKNQGTLWKERKK